MIKKISIVVTKWLLQAGAISIEDKELYEYAAYSFFFSLIPLALVIVFGIVFNMVVEGILMILPFMFVRKFSGGLHLKSAKICLVSSSVLLVSFLFLIKAVHAHGVYYVHTAAVFLFAIQLFILSPVDSEARRLSEKERFVFRKTARIIVILSCATYFALFLFKLYAVAIPIGSGLILSGLLQLPCIFSDSPFRRFIQ